LLPLLASLDDPVVATRLHTDEVGWLTTLDDRNGQPQSSPVWFHWNGTDLLVLTQPSARKIANIAAHPLVAFNLDGGQKGTTVVTIEGQAQVVAPVPERLAAYATKYATGFTRLGTDTDRYLGEFSAVIRITPTRARVFPSM
jgi:PPOX class probable F420-dependent enzyme